MKPVTLYIPEDLYSQFQFQAQKKETKAAELIRIAMEDYAARNFFQKNSLESLVSGFGSLKSEAVSDFIKNPDWKSELQTEELEEKFSRISEKISEERSKSINN